MIELDEPAITEKEADALKIIDSAFKLSKRPAILSSFGKDSLVVIDLAKKLNRSFDIIHFTSLIHGGFLKKRFPVFEAISKLDVDIHTYPPSKVDYFQDGDSIMIFWFFYIDGTHYLSICFASEKKSYKKGQSVGKVLCAVRDFLCVPVIDTHSFPWDCILSGYKRSDPLPAWAKQIGMQTKIPLRAYAGKCLATPILDWSDDDVWAYMDAHDLPYDRDRYRDNPSGALIGREVDPDYLPTCFECIDYRNGGKVIHCPKHKSEVPFVGKKEADHKAEIEALIKASSYRIEIISGGNSSMMRNGSGI